MVELDEDDFNFVDEIVRNFNLKYNGRIGSLFCIFKFMYEGISVCLK